jgi:hypothetical protein
LFTKLKTAGYPVAYREFIVDNNNPPPAPPYVVYLRTFDNNIASDAKVHGKFKTYQIELYTDKKDPAVEKKLEEILNTIGTDYSTSEDYIESEALYQVVYQIKIIERG